MILVPHVAHMDEADVTGLEAFRRREREKREDQPGGRLTLLPFVMKAVAVGLKESPQLNASLDPFSEEVVYKKYYNIGFAADTPKGLLVPVVPNVDKKSILQISADVYAVAMRAREDKLSVDDLRGGTFTVTNVGAIGGFGSMPTINYPEVAILAMGRVTDKPVVRDGQIVIRTILPVTLTYDHRVIDGADAARFTTKLVERLSDPNLLLLEM
jgi:pyruvate dehydrogenase E2 component (dihydrolipoamide acetyltransferase)